MVIALPIKTIQRLALSSLTGVTVMLSAQGCLSGADTAPAGTVVGLNATPYTYTPLATLPPSSTILWPTATPTDAPLPTPTPHHNPTGTATAMQQYVVQPGDTLWSIALSFGLTVDDLVAANPGIDPNTIYPHQVLIIPLNGTPIPPNSTLPQGAIAYVSTGGERLRLRAGPSTAEAVLAMLDDNTELHIVGRSDDFYWLEVTALPSGLHGWVMRQYVETLIPLENVPVTFNTPALPTNAPLATPSSQNYPYIENITPHARDIFLRGQSLGNRPTVFSKVGDSITANEAFLVPIGLGDYNLRDHTYLQPVIDYFSQTVARDANSFANTSLAAKGGWSAWQVITPRYADPTLCQAGETPLECEYRLVRPSIALIMLGTNDVMTTPSGTYESWMRQIVKISLERGVIPVLSTIPDFKREGYEERVLELNGIIRRLAYEYDIPLWDYWAALQDLPNKGLSDDGVHPSWAVPADFKPYFLQYGMTMRNLTALQALDAIWRQVILAGQPAPNPD